VSLPASGLISLSDVRTELGSSGTISLGDTAVRTLFGKSSGLISLGDGRGKSKVTGGTGGTVIATFDGRLASYTQHSHMFAVPNTGTYTILAVGEIGFDIWLEINTGFGGIAYNDDYLMPNQSRIVSALSDTGAYYAVVGGIGASYGSYTITITSG